MGTELTFTMPDAPPEDYLRLVQWWRDATRFAISVATLGGSAPRHGGNDPVLDLIDLEAPSRMEAEAREALRRGRDTIAPVFRVDPALAAEARRRGRRRLEWVQNQSGRGAPALDPRLRTLIEAGTMRSDETFREAGIDPERPDGSAGVN
jgi:hypothetical protein